MGEHTDILLWIAGWAWVSLVAFIVWLFKKLHRVESDIQERRGIVNTAVAVLKSSQEDLRKEFDKEMKRNAIDHQTILDRIDSHHERTMTRFDTLTRAVKNGHS